MQNHTEKFYDLLQRFRTVMLVTHEGDDVHTRPMGVAELKPNCELTFFTSRSTPKVAEIVNDQRVDLICQDALAQVTLKGTATIDRDKAHIEALWDESYKVWFPEGKDDPSLCLVTVHPQEGEYWDQSGTKGIRYLFEAAKAYANGTTPKTTAEQHDKAHF